MSTIIEGQNHDFIEQDCVFEFEGRAFEYGGSYLLKRTDTGLREGILYLYRIQKGNPPEPTGPCQYKIGTWDGSIKVHAVCYRSWQSNFGDERKAFTFHWKDGKRFWGVNAGNNDIVRVKEYKNQA